MAISLNSGRQEVIAARLKVSLGTGNDVDVQGTFPAVSLPEGAVVVGGFINVTDASTVAATLQLGTYSAAVALDAVAKTDLTISGDEEAVAVFLRHLLAVADPVLEGAVEIVVQYIVDSRAAFSQG